MVKALLKVIEYQRRRDLHPLTCPWHGNTCLVPSIDEKGILLWCPRRGCGYEQRMAKGLLARCIDAVAQQF